MTFTRGKVATLITFGVAAIIGGAVGFLTRSSLMVSSGNPDWWVAGGTLTLALVTAASIAVTELRDRRREAPTLKLVFLDSVNDSAEPVGAGTVLAIKNVGVRTAEEIAATFFGYAANDGVAGKWAEIQMLPTILIPQSRSYLEASPGSPSRWVVHADTYGLADPKMVKNLPNEETEWTLELSWANATGYRFPPVRRVLQRLRTVPQLDEKPSQYDPKWRWYDVTFPGEEIEPISTSLRRLRRGRWKRPTSADRRNRSDLR